MDDIYNNSENQDQNTYGGNQYQPAQPSIQTQLQYQYQSQDELEEPMSMGEWMIAMLVMMIPCVDIVMMFVWAFSKTEKRSKSNYFKAALIFYAIRLVFVFVMLIIFGTAIIAAVDSAGYYYY